jgi:hypothetical protein
MGGCGGGEQVKAEPSAAIRAGPHRKAGKECEQLLLGEAPIVQKPAGPALVGKEVRL